MVDAVDSSSYVGIPSLHHYAAACNPEPPQYLDERRKKEAGKRGNAARRGPARETPKMNEKLAQCYPVCRAVSVGPLDRRLHHQLGWPAPPSNLATAAT